MRLRFEADVQRLEEVDMNQYYFGYSAKRCSSRDTMTEMTQLTVFAVNAEIFIGITGRPLLLYSSFCAVVLFPHGGVHKEPV